jgi:hypothetical protein
MDETRELFTRKAAAAFVGVSVSTIDRIFGPGHEAREERWPRGKGEGRRPIVKLRRAPLERLKRELGR